VMWWNFIGREHDEVAGYREQWQHVVESRSDDRFSLPPDDPMPPLPAPVLPNVRMLQRG
jgi:quercetin 2,3-dioxygenase